MAITTLNMICSVTYYLELHSSVSLFSSDVLVHQVKLLMLYNVQVINLTCVGKM